MSLRQATRFAAAAGAILGSGAAFAQDEAPAPAPATSAEEATRGAAAVQGVEDIVVTAQRRSENLQDVPIAVSAVTGDTLEQGHVSNLSNLTATIPNVQFTNRGNIGATATLTIRGIGINEGDPFAGTTVGVVIDDVVQAFNVTALGDFFDVDRIEVLRGPQGTLFGANTTAGVINIVTRQPTGQFGV